MKTTCSCGAQMDLIRYVDGKKVCDRCSPINRSGTFLRRMEGEARAYARDIVQPYKDGRVNEDYLELYGKKKFEKAKQDSKLRRNL